MEGQRSAVVVGAGIVGLTTTMRLLEAGWQVELVYAQPPEATTSAVAAAVWYPYGVETSDRHLAWAEVTYRVLQAQSTYAPGVIFRRGRELFQSPTPDPIWAPIVGGVTHPEPGLLPAGANDAWEFTAPIVETPVYLRWLRDQVVDAGAELRQARISSLGQLRTDGQVIVNCSGLGARDLVGDDSVYPMRGQVVRVANPDLKRFTRFVDVPGGGRAYTYPRSSDVILGGTAEPGEWDCTPDPTVTERILRTCAEIEPAVARAEVLGVLTGLRPWRDAGVRLEIDDGGIVHNYGHGGAGVTLAWGCAAEVVRMVESLKSSFN
jgi:D-amino-acid oxidase